jgi:hypothetical protein
MHWGMVLFSYLYLHVLHSIYLKNGHLTQNYFLFPKLPGHTNFRRTIIGGINLRGTSCTGVKLSRSKVKGVVRLVGLWWRPFVTKSLSAHNFTNAR